MQTFNAQVYKIIDYLRAKLHEPEARRLATWIDKLCRLNQEQQGRNAIGFLYQGRYFAQSNWSGPTPPKKPLAFSLTDEIERYLVDETQVLFEQQLIQQALSKLLGSCQDWQDIRDALPECLVSELSAYVSAFSRTREEAWTLLGSDRAIRQYEKIKPKIELYATTRLIY